MKYSLLHIGLCLLYSLGLSSALAQQPFVCNEDLLLTAKSGPDGGSRLFRLYQNADSEWESETVFADAGVEFTAIGYDVDNFLYGLAKDTYEVYRISADGNVELLGVPALLDTNFVYLAGDVAPAGGRLVLVGRNKATGFDERLSTISLNSPNLQVNTTTLITSNDLQIEDIAFDPVFGTIYAFDNKGKRLLNLSWPGGNVTDFPFQQTQGVNQLGALFFTADGELHGYGSATGSGVANQLFHFNKSNGALIGKTGLVSGSLIDGCSCPYRVQFQKTVRPSRTLPCEEILVSYHFYGRGGTTISGIDLLDSFPPDFTIVEIERPPIFGDVVSGVGNSVFEVEDTWILLGRDSITIRVDVGEQPDTVISQALIQDLKAAYGGTRPSDNRETSVVGDPNYIEIIDPLRLFVSDQTFLCQNSSILLDANSNADSYIWNTGETQSQIQVSSPGLYWVEVESSCGLYRDSIWVDPFQDSLWLDLGPDEVLEPGTILDVVPQGNLTPPYDLEWTISRYREDLCPDCFTQLIGPVWEDLTLNLTVEDAYGCKISDERRLEVPAVREVYVPNAFSPDGDGRNDEFFIQGREGIIITELTIADRWGNLVYQSNASQINQPGTGWNGRKNGIALPAAVYIWHMEVVFPDGEVTEYFGDVLLIR
jgi:gliding motility-associated-like protein